MDEKENGFLQPSFNSKEDAAVGEWLLRIGIFGTFLGHGLLALHGKESWIPLITAFGLSKATAVELLPLIGIHDLLVAGTALLFPSRVLLLWASLWAFATAWSRIVAGEPAAEFLEHTANWAAPLALFAMREIAGSRRNVFRTAPPV